MAFTFMELDLQGAFLISDFYVGDERGYLKKTFEKALFAKAGIAFSVTESFVSCSMKNVIRGLHFQTDNPQSKIVSVVCGRVWDVIVDLRINSPSFKQWRAQELSADNHLSFFIPRGFAHGFVSLEDNTVMLYQCDGQYDKETDTGIIFNDPELNIKWPIIEGIAIHSNRDLNLGSFHDYLSNPMKDY